MTDETAPGVTNNAAAARFEIHADGATAHLRYEIVGDRIRLIHTEVAESLRGRGYADRLARAALEHAGRERLNVVPFCPFVQAYLRRHPEYVRLVDKRWQAKLGLEQPR